MNKDKRHYDPATDYRIFIRRFDEETRRVTWEFHNSFGDFKSADDARWILSRDEFTYAFICPGDADPTNTVGSKTEQRQVLRDEAEQMRREEAHKL